jgi:hypothetical protein
MFGMFGMFGIWLGMLGILPGIIGIWLGILGMFGIWLGMFLDIMPSQQSLPDFGAFGATGTLGLGAFAGLDAFGWLDVSVSTPEDPAHVPAKKLAAAIHNPAKTASVEPLCSRSLAPTFLKIPISRSFERAAG